MKKYAYIHKKTGQCNYYYFFIRGTEKKWDEYQ
jgi:hypothetical protein